MEDVCINSNSQNQNYDHSGFMYSCDHSTEFFRKMVLIAFMLSCILICLSVPLIFGAIYSLYTQVSSDHVAPIYVINLLVSDILQFGCLVVGMTPHDDWRIDYTLSGIYIYLLLASVGFMVCVALERYLLIVHPLWYRCRRTIKSTVVVCVLVWLLPLVPHLSEYLSDYIHTHFITDIILRIFLLLPLPLFIFFFGATVTALSTSVSISSEDKRQTVGILALVLLTYSSLFLPSVIWSLRNDSINNLNVFFVFVELSPLADLVLFVFIRVHRRGLQPEGDVNLRVSEEVLPP